MSLPKFYVLVGNPGSGKSTTGNAALGRHEFESGVAADGSSVTKAAQWKNSEELGGVVVDVPGLAEIKNPEERAKEIEEALKRNGIYKVFFVVRLADGRLQDQDKNTMKSIVDACPTMKYSVIVTQVSPGPEKQTASTTISELLQSYFPQLQNVASAYHVVEEFPEARGNANVLLPAEQQQSLRAFMMSAPESKIMSKDVGKIKSTAQALSSVQDDLQKVKAQAADDQAKQEAERKQVEETNRIQAAEAEKAQQAVTEANKAQVAVEQQVAQASAALSQQQALLQSMQDESSDDDDCVIL